MILINEQYSTDKRLPSIYSLWYNAEQNDKADNKTGPVLLNSFVSSIEAKRTRTHTSLCKIPLLILSFLAQYIFFLDLFRVDFFLSLSLSL